eukprot:TRINITY_DN1947_c0_g1_i1.p1 TRINITY_DN1947_c0_g1~~TRINITY_DN1947_c0_g1_i1.p1  ORF type:complete len:793 (-),score=145.58 TRINITY_DN1947_c0_g1_i1:20-2398(-)
MLRNQRATTNLAGSEAAREDKENSMDARTAIGQQIAETWAQLQQCYERGPFRPRQGSTGNQHNNSSSNLNGSAVLNASGLLALGLDKSATNSSISSATTTGTGAHRPQPQERRQPTPADISDLLVRLGKGRPTADAQPQGVQLAAREKKRRQVSFMEDEPPPNRGSPSYQMAVADDSDEGDEGNLDQTVFDDEEALSLSAPPHALLDTPSHKQHRLLQSAEGNGTHSHSHTLSDCSCGAAQELRVARSQVDDLVKAKHTVTLELQQLRSEHRESQARLEQVEAELRSVAVHRQAVTGMQQENLKLREELTRLTKQLEAAQHELEESGRNFMLFTETWERTEKENGELLHEAEKLRSLTADLQGQLAASEQSRRQLHNAVQELKGNIRVICRVRPQLPSEKGKLPHCLVPFAPSHSLASAVPSPASVVTTEFRGLRLVVEDSAAPDGHAHPVSASGERREFEFEFDRVFPPAAQQEDVYQELGPLVQSALDGFRVAIFAYGPTGGGKTHTMEGPTEATNGVPDLVSAQRGVIPRAVAQVFAAIGQRQAAGWQHALTLQVIEIYNDRIRDLLLPHDPTAAAAPIKKHEIKHDARGQAYVTGVTELPVKTPDSVLTAVQWATASRASGSTACNDRSSRSHLIVTLRIRAQLPSSSRRQAEEGDGAVVLHGALNLIDLAGSERLKQSHSSGETLKETQHINKSLACLGDVIAALHMRGPVSNVQQHVPFRNSKLTHLLKDDLQNGAKVLMFINVSPLAEHAAETLCSLRFAQKVSRCEVGLPQRTCINTGDESLCE